MEEGTESLRASTCLAASDKTIVPLFPPVTVATGPISFQVDTFPWFKMDRDSPPSLNGSGPRATHVFPRHLEEFFDSLKSTLMVNSIATGFRSRVDGIRSCDVALLAQDLRTDDLSNFTEERMLHERTHSKPIGVLLDSKVTWLNWWEFPSWFLTEARAFGRGSSWRFFKPLPKHVKDFRNRLLSKVAPARMDNFMHSGELRRWKNRLQLAGWLVRKEDRGKRFVFVPTQWEQDCWVEECKKRSILQVDQGQDGAHAYFLVKTHKPEVSGRCIEANRSPNKPKLPRAIRDVIKNCDWNCTSIQQMANRFALINGRKWVISGDIQKLFPSVDTSELLAMLRVEFGSAVTNFVKNWIESSFISFNNCLWKAANGLPMGGRLSPGLATYYLLKKEEAAVRLLSTEGIVLGRYVDDTTFSIPSAGKKTGTPGQNLIKFCQDVYENAVSPLKVTWELGIKEDLKVLDMSLRQLNWQALKIVSAADTTCTVGGAVPSTVLSACGTERLRRIATIEAMHRVTAHAMELDNPQDIIRQWEGYERALLPTIVPKMVSDWQKRGYWNEFQNAWNNAKKKPKKNKDQLMIQIYFLPEFTRSRGRKLLDKVIKAISRKKAKKCCIRWLYDGVTKITRVIHS